MSASHQYRGRRAASIENDELRVTVLEEGGHIAEILDKRTGINPLWTPPWTSIEPSTHAPAAHPAFGTGADARLLAGIMGHNLCLDIFGGPSDEEAAAGLTAHGEASVVRYDVEAVERGVDDARQAAARGSARRARASSFAADRCGSSEAVENLAACDRPIGWTQHVTLGPPFLEKGLTAVARLGDPLEGDRADLRRRRLPVAGAAFDWPHAPRIDGGTADLRRFTDAAASSAYTAHLMDPAVGAAFFVAFSPTPRLAFGYAWTRDDFPWLGIWEENHSRLGAPWNGDTLTWGMEFGVSPMPETRRAMIDRGRLFDVPTYRWIPARSRVDVEYQAIFVDADAVPDRLEIRRTPRT